MWPAAASEAAPDTSPLRADSADRTMFVARSGRTHDGHTDVSLCHDDIQGGGDIDVTSTEASAGYDAMMLAASS